MNRARPTSFGKLWVAIAAILGGLLLAGGAWAGQFGDCGPLLSVAAAGDCCPPMKLESCCCPEPNADTFLPDSDVQVPGTSSLGRLATACPCQLSVPSDPVQPSDRPVQSRSNPNGSSDGASSAPILAALSPPRTDRALSGVMPPVALSGLPIYLHLAHLRF